jgi:hypothetical protein
MAGGFDRTKIELQTGKNVDIPKLSDGVWLIYVNDEPQASIEVSDGQVVN